MIIDPACLYKAQPVYITELKAREIPLKTKSIL